MTTATRPKGLSNFDFDLIGVGKLPFIGYNSSSDRTTVTPNTLIYGSKNVYKKLSGTIAVRPGLKRRGSTDSTSAGVKSSFEWSTWDGRTLPLRIANSKLQVESDIVTSGTFVWYDLLTSLTTTAWVFDAWWDNTAKKDVLLFVGGSSTLYNWSGAAALFVSYAAGVITLDRNVTTAGFSASGSVLINGVTYTYTGRSGSTLTGTSDASAATANMAVFEATGSTATTPASGFTNDFLKVINNQVFVGSYTSRLVYASKNTSYTDYTYSGTRVPGEGMLITLDNVGAGITTKNGNPWIAAGTSDWYEVTLTQITVGSTLSEQIKVVKKPVSALSAPLKHDFIDKMGDNIVYLDQSQQVRFIGQLTSQFETKYPNLSLAVEDEFSNETFTGGHLRVIGNIIHITAPNSGKDYMFETREYINNFDQLVTERFWHPPQIRNIARFAVIGGVTYGHSNANPQIYQVWNTNQWHDDGPSGTDIPYDSYAQIAYDQRGRRQGKISFDKVYVELYMTPGSKIGLNVYVDYQGETAIQSPFINDPANNKLAKTYVGLKAPSLGDSSLGDNPLGDGLNIYPNDQFSLPKGRAILGINPTDCFEYALEVYSQNVNDRWELICIGTNAVESENNAVELKLKS